MSMELADQMEMPYVVLACWVGPVELVEVVDACVSLDLSSLGSALVVPRLVDEVDCLESWEQLSVDGRYLEAGHPMYSLALAGVEAALVLNQSVEVRLQNRMLLDDLCLVNVWKSSHG